MARNPALALTVLLALYGTAEAHPMLKVSWPERASSVRTSPNEIRLTFSEGVSAAASTFILTDAAKKAYGLGADRSDPADGNTLIVPVPRRLPPGAYTLRWMAGSAAHSSVPGTLRFTVQP